MSTRPPNILLIVADDHQHDVIAALGHPVVRTPTLDTFVQQGTTFSRTYTMGSLVPAVCSPSRASLLTGTSIYRAVANPQLSADPNYRAVINPEQVTLPELLRSAGYETFISGKWHNDLASLRRSFEHGRSIFWGGMCDHDKVPVFDLPRECSRVQPGLTDESAFGPLARAARVATGFSTQIFGSAIAEFLKTRSGDRPFFAYLALTSPHDPRTPPREFRELYSNDTIPLPENFMPQHPFDNGELDVRDEILERKPLQPLAVRRHLADYYGMISHHDREIGRLVELLRATHQLERTVIVYVSDHGLALGRHGLFGKQNLYEHSVRVPMILSGPGVPRDLRVTTPVYAFDLYATLAEVTGVLPPLNHESHPLPFRGDPTRELIGALYKDVQRMITSGGLKLIRYEVNGVEREQLFELASDPHELRDLVAENSPAVTDQRTRLRMLLARWQHRIGDRWMLPRGERLPLYRPA